MSRLSLAQSKLNEALATLESALASARANPNARVDCESSVDGVRLVADLQAVDAKVAKAVDMINAFLVAGNEGGDKP